MSTLNERQPFLGKPREHIKCDESTKSDIVFVVDQSGKFGSQHIDVSRRLLHDVIDTIGTQNKRYALVTYGEESKAKVCFDHLTKDVPEAEVKAEVDRAHITATEKQVEFIFGLIKIFYQIFI